MEVVLLPQEAVKLGSLVLAQQPEAHESQNIGFTQTKQRNHAASFSPPPVIVQSYLIPAQPRLQNSLPDELAVLVTRNQHTEDRANAGHRRDHSVPPAGRLTDFRECPMCGSEAEHGRQPDGGIHWVEDLLQFQRRSLVFLARSTTFRDWRVFAFGFPVARDQYM